LTAANRSTYHLNVGPTSEVILMMGAMSPKTVLTQPSGASTGAISAPNQYIFTGDSTNGWRRTTTSTF
jgi:hypothetical protein